MSAIVGGAVAAAGLATAAGAWVVPPWIARKRGEARLRELCRATRSLVMTYDDGPGPRATPPLLDLLAEHSARATFFLLGSQAERAPDIVERLVAEGHEIGCHAHDHVHAWKALPGKVLADIDRGYATLGAWIPADATFRPPYGKLNLASWMAVRRRRAPLGWWTIDAGDTWDAIPTPESVVDRVLADGGGVVLLHDMDRRDPRADERARFVRAATGALLEAAAREGLTVRTLGELAEPSALG